MTKHAGPSGTRNPLVTRAETGRALLYLAVFLLLMASRRWQQLWLPQVWDEDATQIIHGFVSQGWSAFFLPVNGYLVTVPKLISALALSISFVEYPLISTLLCWWFMALVGLAVALAPTRLRGRFLCALAIITVPSDPEVFMVPLYSYAWASLLLLLLLLWDERRACPGWRVLFLLLGGLSSPIIVMTLPVFYYRAWRFRALSAERMMAVLATLVAAIQGYFIVTGSAAHAPPLADLASTIVPRFFGTFLVGNLLFGDPLYWIAGICLLGVLAVWAWEDRNRAITPVMLYLLAGSIALTVARVNPAMLRPAIVGPRYFFFLFVGLSWLLIQCYLGTRYLPLRRTVGGLAALVLLNSLPVWSRPHDDLHWATNVYSCPRFSAYEIPVQWDGHEARAWHMPLSGQQCAELLRHDWFAAAGDSLPTFPYVHAGENASRQLAVDSLLGNRRAKAPDSEQSLAGHQVFSSALADGGELRLRVHRGEQLLYRTSFDAKGLSAVIEGHEAEFAATLPGAVGPWVPLDFSSSRLPAVFVLKIGGRGKAESEWVAVALKN